MNAASSSEGYAGAWLGDRLLLLAGPGSGGTAAGPRASVAGSPISLETHEAPHTPPEARVMIVRFPAPANGTHAAAAEVEVEVGGSRLSLSRPRAGLTAMDLSAFLRSRLAGLDPGTREDLVDFIACACAQDLEGPGRAALADHLKLIRDTLRERLPVCEIREDMPRALALDDILALDDRTFWIKGWVWDADDRSPRVEVLSPEGARAEILESAFRWRRRDIEQLHAGLGVKRSLNGFVARVTLATPSRRSDGWIARISPPGGEGVETAGPEVIRAPATVQDLILRDVSWADRDRDLMVAEYAYPAISRVLDRVADLIEVDQTFQFGEPPEDPTASIIVPLAGETNAIEHHLIQFRSDPEVCGADLIYLVDSTDRADALASRLAELHWLYPVPFRLVTLTSEAGPAVMNSIGASIARSSRLVFLSPDVMPDFPGWLGAMRCFYDSQPSIGALGPRLIYEDRSLQHAGIGFDLISPEEAGLPTLGGDVWQARSFFKGLPQAYEAATGPRPVPAVSGACMMIERDLFEAVGGMRNIYVESEYEDVDLCLRVAASGHENWYTPDATLFNLEGRSEIEPEDTGRQYNVLLLTHLWREQIEMAREEIEAAG